MTIITSIKSGFMSETNTWKNRVLSNGGDFLPNSIFIANNLIKNLKDKSYYSKIIYLLPMLGVGINAARVPLIDKLNVGSATNSGFTDSAFSQTTGLQGNNTNYFTTGVFASNLNSAGNNNAGFGYWQTAVGATPWCFASISNTNEFHGLALWTSDELFYYGPGGSDTRTSSASGNHHYYGQRISASDRKLYRNSVQIASTSASHSASGTGDNSILLMAVDPTLRSSGRCAVAYLTNGELTTNEMLDLHITITNYLMGPTGKI